MKKTWLSLTLCLSIPLQLFAQTILHVNADASGDNDGSSWQHAFNSLEDALVEAYTGTGSYEIYVAAGTYVPSNQYEGGTRDETFAITRGGIKLLGGYNASDGQRNLQEYPTVLSGELSDESEENYCYHVMVIAGISEEADSIVVDGFTIEKGLADGPSYITLNEVVVPRRYGGGMLTRENNGHSRTNIRNCIFRTNRGLDGGGMSNTSNSAPSLTNCSFEGNDAEEYGGAMFNSTNEPPLNLTKCSFSNNTALYGGAISSTFSDAIFSFCSFSNNSASTGGGIQNYTEANSILSNCVFTGNSASNLGKSLSNESLATAVLINSTFVGLPGNPNPEGGEVLNLVGSLTATNCIFWVDSEEVGTTILNLDGSVDVTYSIVKGGYDGEGNLDIDPQFLNADDPGHPQEVPGIFFEGLRLKPCSPAINIGSNEAAAGLVDPAADIAGAPRILFGNIDMGAFESFYNSETTNVIHVNAQIEFSGDGAQWGTALNTLSEALAISNLCTKVDTIKVASGKYYPTGTQESADREIAFVVSRGNIRIMGGYDAISGIRDPPQNAAVLSGEIGEESDDDNSYHVVVIANIPIHADSIIIDGFTIEKGNADGAGSTMINGAAVWWGYGGGMVNQQNNGNTKIAVRSTTFSNNAALFGGGGMYNLSAAPTLVNTVFAGNSAFFGGGGMYNDTASPTILNCTFAGNSAEFAGGGISNVSSSPNLVNSIIWGNSAQTNPGISNSGSSPEVSFSMVEGGYEGEGNSGSDPLFMDISDAAGPDLRFGSYDDGFRLQSCSPAINAGLNTAVSGGIASDYPGNARIQLDRVDMGAYESNGDASTAEPAQDFFQTFNEQSAQEITHYADHCNDLIASVTGNGSPSSIAGKTSVTVWIQNPSPVQFVKRHFEISPDDQPSTAEGRVTLYFTQADFDDFNAGNSTKLPQSPDDISGISNLLIEKRAGTNSDQTGLPTSYSGDVETIASDHIEVVWSQLAGRWEVSFDTEGFSGFFVKTQPGALPLRLISFTGSREGTLNQLQWSTAEEVDVDHFVLQRSQDGKTFTSVAEIPALNGPRQAYNYPDSPFLSGTLYYRLRMVDTDGSYADSKIVAIFAPGTDALTLGPNPAGDYVIINNASPALLGTEAHIFNAAGQAQKAIRVGSESHKISLTDLPSGLYFIRFANGETRKLVRK